MKQPPATQAYTSNDTQTVDEAPSRPIPSLWELFIEFFIIGAVSFGGGIIAYEKILLTEKKHWLTDDEFMASLAISQTMPGLNSVNLAVLSGDRLRGVWGAVFASIGLILPGAAFVLVVGLAYLAGSDHKMANLLLAGVGAGATGLLAAITAKIGVRQFTNFKPLMILIATFVLMSLVNLSLPYVLLIMAPIAIFLYRPKSQKSEVKP
ncbi:MAG: chromate transporter [Burkholderiaceae bacterium]|nr:chromate transporter [Burkholderiaceae bacterium]